MSFRQRFQDLDIFGVVPDELVVASNAGAAISAATLLVCLVLFLCEFFDFMRVSTTSHLELDSDIADLIRVHFNVSMFDIDCEHVVVGTWDAFGTSRMNVTRHIVKQPVDHKGDATGHPYTERELSELEFGVEREALKAEAQPELGLSGNKAQASVGEVVQVQQSLENTDFTFLFFCDPKLGPCRLFFPVWDKFSAEINEAQVGLLDKDQNPVNCRAMMIDCSDSAFIDFCKLHRVKTYPVFRLYARSVNERPPSVDIQLNLPEQVVQNAKMGRVAEFSDAGLRQFVDAFKQITQHRVKEFHLHTNATLHDSFQSGCRLQGYVSIPRVPSAIYFEAVDTVHEGLNCAFTNVSHVIHHLSFGDSMSAITRGVPSEYLLHAQPLSGRHFVVKHFHLAPQHYIKVLHGRYIPLGGHPQRFYSHTHQWSSKCFGMREVPAAKIHLDFSPMEMVITQLRKPWYDFFTSTLAIIGGLFIVSERSAWLCSAGH